MKLFSGVLAATVLAAALATGCSETPHRYSEIRPSLHVTPVQTMQVGESRRVAVTTQNLVGARAIRWDVSPTNGRIQLEQGTSGQTALFTADQIGQLVDALAGERVVCCGGAEDRSAGQQDFSPG